MIEAALAQQLAPILAPALPYLLKYAAAGKDAAKKALGDKFVEDTWDKATAIWKILKPEVDKKPEVAKELEKVAEKGSTDPRLESILSWKLEELDLSPEKLEDIKKIVAGTFGSKKISATQGGVAYGDDARDNITVTGASGNINIGTRQEKQP